jgi:hypothetical protein
MATTSTAEAFFEEKREKIFTLGAWRLLCGTKLRMSFCSQQELLFRSVKEKKHFVHFQAAQRT